MTILLQHVTARSTIASSAPSAIPALTSLRFFAAVGVLWQHSGSAALQGSGFPPGPLLNMLRNGYLGVSFFFVLSGFILTYVYCERLAGPGALPKYYGARFARVFPVYILSVLAMLPLTACHSGLNCAPQFFMLQMWLPLNAAPFDNWNGPAWTLSVELLFYLVFPILLGGMPRLGNPALAGVAAGMAALIAAGRLSAISSSETAPYLWLTYLPLPLLRLPEFAFGMCLALLLLRGAAGRVWRWLPLASLLLSLGILAATQSLWVAPAATLSFGLAIFSVAAGLQRGWLAWLLTSPAMVTLGGASYSLYLLQAPLHAWLHAGMTGGWELAGRLIYQPLLLALAILVFWFVEEPLRRVLRPGGGGAVTRAPARLRTAS